MIFIFRYFPSRSINLNTFITRSYFSYQLRTLYICGYPIHTKITDYIINYFFPINLDQARRAVNNPRYLSNDCDSLVTGAQIISRDYGDGVTTKPQLNFNIRDNIPNVPQPVGIRQPYQINVNNPNLESFRTYEEIPISIDSPSSYSKLMLFDHMHPVKLFDHYDNYYHNIPNYIYLNQHNVLIKYPDYNTFAYSSGSFVDTVKIINGTTLQLREYNEYLQRCIHVRDVRVKNQVKTIADLRFLKEKNIPFHNQLDYKLFLGAYETVNGLVYIPKNFVNMCYINFIPSYIHDINPWNYRTNFVTPQTYERMIKSQSVLGYKKEYEPGIMSSKYDISAEFFSKHLHYPIQKPTNPIYHPHPNGHFGRAFLSCIIYNDAANCAARNTFWVHVGENAARALKHDRPGHILNCIYDGYDYQRQTKYINNYRDNLFKTNIKNYRFTTGLTMCLCSYTTGVCPHIRMFMTHLNRLSHNKFNSISHFFVHSAYYIKLQPISDFIYIIVNIYPQGDEGVSYPFNSGEGSWYRHGNTVYTKVNGNESIYSHPDFSLNHIIHSVEDIPDEVVLDDGTHRIKYHVDILATLPYSHNTEVALKLSIIPFNPTQVQQIQGVAVNVSKALTIRSADILKIFGLDPTEPVYNFDVNDPYAYIEGHVYKYTSLNGQIVYIYNGQAVFENPNDKLNYNRVIDLTVIDAEYNYYIKNLSQALLKNDEEAYKQLKLSQFTKHPSSDVDSYKDVLILCDLLAAKLVHSIQFHYFPSFGLSSFFTKINVYSCLYFVMLLVLVFVNYVFNYVQFPHSLSPIYHLVIDPMTHLIDNKFKFDIIYQLVVSRVFFFTAAYKFYVVFPSSFCYLVALTSLVSVLGIDSSYCTTVISYVGFSLNVTILFLHKLKDISNFVRNHMLMVLFVILVQLFTPAYSLPEYLTHCSFQPIRRVILDAAAMILSFYDKQLKFLEQKPAIAISYKDKNSKAKICNFDKHNQNHVSQICPNIVGHRSQNIPIQLHQCPVTSLNAAVRNMVRRETYDIKSINSFKSFVDKRYEHYDFPALSNFLSTESQLTIRDFIISNYSGSQLKEYLDAYNKIFVDCKPIQLSLMKSHVKIDELQYLSETPKDRNITAQDSCSKVIMAYITYLSAKFYKANDYSYSSGLNFASREFRMERIISTLVDPVEVDIDGSGYDSTQYDILKTIVDVPVYLFILKHVAKYMEVNPGATAHILINQLQNVYNKILNSNYKVLGTVASGMMSTSDGNTRRSIMYIRYALKDLVECKDYFLEALGDDIKIICEKSKSKIIVDMLKSRVYADAVHKNLGQIAKYINVTKISEGNFISTTTLVNSSRSVKMVRQFDRVLSSFAFSIKVVNFTSNISRWYKIFLLNISKYYSMMDWCKGITFYETLANFHLNYAKFLARRYNFNLELDSSKLALYRSTKDMTRGSVYKGNFDNEFYDHLNDKYAIQKFQIDELMNKLNSCDFTTDVISDVIDQINSINYDIELYDGQYLNTYRLNNRYRTFSNHVKDKSLVYDVNIRMDFPILRRYSKPTLFSIRGNVQGLGYENFDLYYHDSHLKPFTLKLDKLEISIVHQDKVIFNNRKLVGFPNEIIINLNESS